MAETFVALMLPLMVRPPKVGAAVIPIFWIVFTLPLETLKLDALNCAIPLVAVDALFIVIVVPAAVLFAIDKVPSTPLREVTPEPVPPGHVWNDGAPVVDIKHSPVEPAFTVVSGSVPWPITTPFFVKEVVPVPPEDTPKGEFNKRLEILVGPRVVFPTTFKEPCRVVPLVTLRLDVLMPAINLLKAWKLFAAPSVAMSEGISGVLSLKLWTCDNILFS